MFIKLSGKGDRMTSEIKEKFDGYCKELLAAHADIADEQSYLRFVREIFRAIRVAIDDYTRDFPQFDNLRGDLTLVAWYHLERFRESYTERFNSAADL